MRRIPARHFLLCLLAFFVLAAPALAAPTFPPLTGRVVDAAHILPQSTKNILMGVLWRYEKKTGNQVVVVTLPSLQGVPIEEYGYQLGRNWAIGQKGKNNGVLLIVAPKEHKVRIEVGYGAEPLLTDAVSALIIHNVMLPSLESDNTDKAVLDGTLALTEALGGDGKGADIRAAGSSQPQAPVPVEHTPTENLLYIFLFFFIIWLCFTHPALAWIMIDILSSSSSGRSGYRSGGGDNFRGGGGTFGGGGASGSW